MATKLRTGCAVFRFDELLGIDDGRSGLIQMTFIIEAIKEDQQMTDFRSNCMIAVTLARKLAAEGFTVSITAPTGRLYGADKFNLLLTSESLNSNQ